MWVCCESIAVVAFTLVNLDKVVFNTVNKAVYIINAAAPISTEIFFQPFRLSDTLERTAGNIFQQGIDTL